jgi:hypothetical protein
VIHSLASSIIIRKFVKHVLEEENSMKWLIAIMLLCLAPIGTVSGAEHTANNSTGCVGCDSNSVNVTENKSETFIFIQEGSSGNFVKDSSGNYTLTMNDVIPYTMYFADRPGRDVGLAPMDKFLKGFTFGSSFVAGSPPNAAIILPDGNESSDMVVVELIKPHYNNTTRTLTYTARQLENYTFRSAWFEDQRSKVDLAIPERFDHIVLVIDDCWCNTNSGCASQCRNQCWSWKHLWCAPCGGCCPASSCCQSASCLSSGSKTVSKPGVKVPEHPIKPLT